VSSSNSSAAGSQSRRTFLSHLAGVRGLVYDAFMLFSLKCNFMMSIQLWAFAPNRNNPGRQINSHNPGRRERGAEHPTSHTDIKSEHVSQIDISCRPKKVEHVKSYGGRRHLASHPNAVASYSTYTSLTHFRIRNAASLLPTEVDSIPYPNSIFAKTPTSIKSTF
jgi:hypothetical protein